MSQHDCNSNNSACSLPILRPVTRYADTDMTISKPMINLVLKGSDFLSFVATLQLTLYMTEAV